MLNLVTECDWLSNEKAYLLVACCVDETNTSNEEKNFTFRIRFKTTSKNLTSIYSYHFKKNQRRKFIHCFFFSCFKLLFFSCIHSFNFCCSKRIAMIGEVLVSAATNQSFLIPLENWDKWNSAVVTVPFAIFWAVINYSPIISKICVINLKLIIFVLLFKLQIFIFFFKCLRTTNETFFCKEKKKWKKNHGGTI